MPDKILSYIGFAIKARKAKTGVNTIEMTKGRIPLIIVCDSASLNTKNDALKLAKKHFSKLVVSKEYKLEDIFNKQNCKVCAICDKSLASAILNNLNEKFVIWEA